MDDRKRHDALIELHRAQWNIVNSLEILDWRVALLYIPLITATSFIFGIALELGLTQPSIYVTSVRMISLIAYLISLYGMWTVAKGQAHSKHAFSTLRKIEEELGLGDFVFHRDKKGWYIGLWETVISRRFLLFILYFVLGSVSYSMYVVPLDEWGNLNLLGPERLAVPLFLSLVIVGLQYYDHRLHVKRGKEQS